jgi:predicted Zn-dependent protease
MREDPQRKNQPSDGVLKNQKFSGGSVMKQMIIFFCVALSCALTLDGCATLKSINIFPESKDIELGLQVDQEIRKDPKSYPILSNRPDVKAYVEQVGKKILASPEIRYRETFAYKFEVIKDDTTVNAFCTPGGFIYVYTGLMKFIDNEATLAGVVAHEIAHAERRHATTRMTKALGVQLVFAIVLGEKPGETSMLAANLFAGLGLLANSRGDEVEADAYSFKYLQSTEYYPGAIRFFFDKVLANSPTRGGMFERLLSTHPLPQDRVDNVKKMLAQIGDPVPGEKQLLSQRFQQLRKTL